MRTWAVYRDEELQRVTPLLRELGLVLDDEQVHTRGDRALFSGVQDVGAGGRKLVLTGSRIEDGKRVVIKATREEGGKRELERERTCRRVLRGLNFARNTFSEPEELLVTLREGYLIVVSEYIHEDLTLLEHSIEEQFFLVVRALEAQEGVHVTTSSHALAIESAFGLIGARDYLERFQGFCREVERIKTSNAALARTLVRATEFLKHHTTLIERYCGFLTHSDFSPQNLRIRDRRLYLLDYASMHFGNKYESWARLMNFMTQHNPTLERYLAEYVRANRGEDEYLCLRLMRVYKLGFLIQLWARVARESEGAQHELMNERVAFWTTAMEAVLEDTPVPIEVVRVFNEATHRLRSPEEKARQREILMRKELRV